jgi:DNA-binding MarR family transcriptional regulator
MTRLPDRQHAVNVAASDSPSGAPAPEARSPAGDAFSGLVIRVFRLAGLLAVEGDALARPAGQTTARWQVLAAVDDAPRSVAEIGRVLGLARQSVQRVADALEDGGFVRYEDNPRHRRARLVVPTEAGTAALRRIEREQQPWADAIGAAVGQRDLERLRGLLDRVTAAVEAQAASRIRDEGRA